MTHPYGMERYAESLSHVGEPFAVRDWDSHLLIRGVEGGRRDATGPYPLTVIAPDADIKAGLARLKAEGMVSIVLVLDDIQRPPLDALKAFDFVRPFKTHHLHDRTLVTFAYGRHHRYNVKRAHGQVRAVEISLADHLDDWQRLYQELVGRHRLSGVHAFPTVHFKILSQLPGVRTFGAFADGVLVSAHLFVTHGDYAISHLVASTAQGYELGAAYAVNDAALEGLGTCQVINFGGGAGSGDDPSGGLARFKAGFSNRIAQSYLCGKVLDHVAYDKLSAGLDKSDFFPAYRSIRRREQFNGE